MLPREGARRHREQGGLDVDAVALLIGLLLLLGLGMAVIAWFLGREIRKTRMFFKTLAARLDGSTTKLPFGVTFVLGGIPVRIFVLQGTLQYRAKLELRENPGVLVTRIFKKVGFLDALNYSPGREKFLFHTAIDRQYGFRAKNTRWMREIFDHELQERLAEKGRITRIEITRRAVKGVLLMIVMSEEELQSAEQSIDVLNALVQRLSRSTLAA